MSFRLQTSATARRPHCGGVTIDWALLRIAVCTSWILSRTASNAAFRATLLWRRLRALHLPARLAPLPPCRRAPLQSERREAPRWTRFCARTTARRCTFEAPCGVVGDYGVSVSDGKRAIRVHLRPRGTLFTPSSSAMGQKRATTRPTQRRQDYTCSLRPVGAHHGHGPLRRLAVG